MRESAIAHKELQAYNAFDSNEPLKCQVDKIVAPKGFDFIEHWTGVDSVFNRDKTVECYGVVFRSQVAPYTYIFAFRGTSSLLDVLDDLGAEKKKFTANEPDIHYHRKRACYFPETRLEKRRGTMTRWLSVLIEIFSDQKQKIKISKTHLPIT